MAQCPEQLAEPFSTSPSILPEEPRWNCHCRLGILEQGVKSHFCRTALVPCEGKSVYEDKGNTTLVPELTEMDWKNAGFKGHLVRPDRTRNGFTVS